ncbi:hypothetical protein FACS189440_12690 [Bacteroidia bacterium]|nr:hypothetical protein FACS189440_12690 [Bacteroidia bacterium]
MKKVILVMVIALVGIGTVNAQFTKGGKTLSGRLTGFDFSYATGDNDYKNLNVDLSIAGSYFVADNVAINAIVGLSSNKYLENDATTNFTFGVGARYYFLGGLYAGLAYQGVQVQDVDLANYGNLEVGYDYYITDNVFFEPAVYFAKGLSNVDKSSTFGLSIGIGVNF